MVSKVRAKRDPLLHVTRRQDMTLLKKWIFRIVAILSGFVLCAIISSAMGGSFADFFVRSFDACFVNLRTGGLSGTKIISLLESVAILILLALAVVPCFKMKFWNIGAEGQVSFSILICCILQKYLGDSGAMNIANNPASRFFFFVIVMAGSILAGALWAVIPAIFKAKFHTNETLFTLMMNYVAIILTSVVISIWDPQHGNIQPFDNSCYFPIVGGQAATINLIIVAVVIVLVFMYLKFTKRGYEINVVGGSVNTAKYIGLSVDKTIIRTMILSGAICGLCGALLVLGEHNNLTTTIVAGRGFMGVMIAWLSGFGPIELTLYTFVAAYLLKGCRSVNYNLAFPDIMLAILFFVLIACEFFVSYEVHCDKLHRFLKRKFPKLFKEEIAPQLEAPTNINDIKEKIEKDTKEVDNYGHF